MSMRIARAELKPCTMSKDDPHWRFALAASPVTEGVVVMLESDNGIRGYGYGSATAHMGAPQSRLFAALDHFKGLIFGRDASAIDEIMAMLDHDTAGHNQAKAAIECALYDLNARAKDVPLYQLLGRKVRDSVPILRILSIKTPAEMAKNALTLIDQGYRHLKIKLEGIVADDVARVRAIRRAAGDALHLTVDANQSYSVEDAIAALTRMAEFAVALAEQPVHKDDLAGLKRVTDSVSVTVEADESAHSLARVEELAKGRIVDAISLKIPKLGGLRNTLAAARICEAEGLHYRMGAAVGSRLLSAQGMHLAAVLPKIEGPCELGEFARLLDDPFEGIEIENGILRLPEGPGSGVSLRAGDETATAGHREKQPAGRA
jgi:L-alanine-DL-glutamate epimerase-like enolase superfamily enzyme